MELFGCGAFLCLYSVILAFNLKNEPGKGPNRQGMVVDNDKKGVVNRKKSGDKKRAMTKVAWKRRHS